MAHHMRNPPQKTSVEQRDILLLSMIMANGYRQRRYLQRSSKRMVAP
jgi:hypothetical protein